MPQRSTSTQQRASPSLPTPRLWKTRRCASVPRELVYSKGHNFLSAGYVPLRPHH
ncbi:unnamed protein product [Laminaria digitata]